MHGYMQDINKGDLMIVGSMITLDGTPDCAALLGQEAPTGFIDSLNQRYSDVMGHFGSAKDVFANQFNQFRNVVVEGAKNTFAMINKLVKHANNPDSFLMIESEEDLLIVPKTMYAPILTYAPIRDLFDNEQIYGWGMDPETLPEGDPYKHICEFGLYKEDKNGKWPEYTEWLWKSTDPNWSDEERHQVFESRQYIENYICEQLNGDRVDPTGLIEGSTIGTIR